MNRYDHPRMKFARAELRLLVVSGSGVFNTRYDEAEDSESGYQTSTSRLPFRTEISRRPNSFRVGKVSDTSVSSVNQDEYTMRCPYAEAKFCCAERASVGASATGSSAPWSITPGLSTDSQSVQPPSTRAPAAMAMLAQRLSVRIVEAPFRTSRSCE